MPSGVAVLIDCGTCGKSISVLADKCPGCGAPNEWIHPSIKNFIVIKDEIGTSKPFTFGWNKVEIWGQTEAKLPLWILFLVGIPPFVTGVWMLLIVMPVMYVILLLMYGKKETFRANLQSNTWQSTNDIFWMPVKKVLEL